MRNALLAWTALPCLLAAEWRPLFDGKSLAGWTPEGPLATFSAEDGALHTSGAGNTPNWLRTAREYENFRLRFEYKLGQWAESAVALRAPRAGRFLRAGLTLVLAHDFHNEVTPWVTGALAGTREPAIALKPSWGEWHAVEITLDGDRFHAAIDGKAVQDAALDADPELRWKLKRGYIGFPDLGYAAWFRDIRIDELPARRPFVDLFDGHALEGWTPRGGGNWTVRDGAIHGSNGHGVLYAPGEFGDFELTALVRTAGRVNSGVFLRGSPEEGKPRGFEVQIYNVPDGVYPTGSVYNIERSRISADLEGRWFLLQIEVVGRRCLVRVDGETVAETERLPEALPGRGRIGLQIHKENAAVEFRDPRVYPR